MKWADAAVKHCKTGFQGAIEKRQAVMQLSTIIASIALVLAGVLVTGYAAGDESIETPAAKATAQDKIDQREAQRRAAVAEHKKRKEEFARRCTKPGLSDAELEACRAAYRRL
jgi:hypothetical protein